MVRIELFQLQFSYFLIVHVPVGIALSVRWASHWHLPELAALVRPSEQDHPVLDDLERLLRS
jgi:hypothetical protein